MEESLLAWNQKTLKLLPVILGSSVAAVLYGLAVILGSSVAAVLYGLAVTSVDAQIC